MEFPCESEVDVQNDHALRFAIVERPAPILEYLKTIASLIGASHILGIFETDDFVKVYFDDKKYVDALIRSGIHVMGHHIKVDYVVPPGKKITLSNIDPVVTNFDLVRLISTFGSIVSPIFRSPISDDVELCHIDYGVRYVYMDLNKSIPNVLEFKYGDQMCKIDVKTEENTSVVSCVKNEPIESNAIESSSNQSPSDVDDEQINVVDDEQINVVDDEDDLDITDPVVVSVQSAAEDGSNQQNEIPSCNQVNNNSMASTANLSKIRRKKIKTSQINKRIKNNIKFKNRRTKRYRITKSRRQVKNKVRIKESPQTPLKNQASSSISALSPLDSSTPLPPINESFISKNSRFILEEYKLASFIEETRYQHAPLEIVKKYIGPDFDSNALICLIVQLHDYRKRKIDDLAVKSRVSRLVKTLKSFAPVE